MAEPDSIGGLTIRPRNGSGRGSDRWKGTFKKALGKKRGIGDEAAESGDQQWIEPNRGQELDWIIHDKTNRSKKDNEKDKLS